MSETIAPSVERNREPILNVLKEYITSGGRLLEIGSGTGEHAVYLAENLEGLQYTTSDVVENHKTISETIKKAGLVNTLGPETLKIGKDDFPKGAFDYVFSANTLHIMSWKENKTFFKLLGKRLREGSLVFFYGPFNYNDSFTSESNAKFDTWLKSENEKSGIRNFEDVVQTMAKFGFKMINDHEMPANNRILVFERLEYQK